MEPFKLTLAELNDVETIYNLEIDSFPIDEAASLDTLKYRISNANQFFYKYVNTNSNEIIGFVNGTCTIHNDIHHDTMTTHDSNGKSLVIHSVTINSNYRKSGHGSNMLRLYLQEIIKKNQSINQILLLSKQNLLQFYLNCNFQLIRKSLVQHGKDIWYEMSLKTIEFRSIDQLQIDAFVMNNMPFTGNPAAVIFEQKDEIWMQNIAMENNLAETSFIVPYTNNTTTTNNNTEYKLRWFTPTKEVELCGHATLAAVHAIYEMYPNINQQKISFHTIYSGILYAQGHVDGSISLDFPITMVTSHDNNKEIYNNYLKLIKIAFKLDDKDILFIGSSKYDLLVEITRCSFASLLDISNDCYDYNAMIEIGGRGVIITCAGRKISSTTSTPISTNNTTTTTTNNTSSSTNTANTTTTTSSSSSNQNDLSTHSNSKGELLVNNDQYHFLSRFFAPRYGINEDPVTGSAHCSLAPYWFDKLAHMHHNNTIDNNLNNTSSDNTINNNNNSYLINSNTTLIGMQASSRSGVIHVSIVNERVIITGKCITTIKSKVLV